MDLLAVGTYMGKCAEYIEQYMPKALTEHKNTISGFQQTDEGVDDAMFRGLGQYVLIHVSKAPTKDKLTWLQTVTNGIGAKLEDGDGARVLGKRSKVRVKSREERYTVLLLQTTAPRCCRGGDRRPWPVSPVYTLLRLFTLPSTDSNAFSDWGLQN